MEKVYSVNLRNEGYTIRQQAHQGRTHIIVPVTMMVEGVHNGSHGALYHSINELGRYPEAWNGRPITIDHPTQNGQSVSANNPTIIDSVMVGRVYNTRVDNNKLKGEAWLDIEKLQAVSQKAFTIVNARQPMEVSVGVFTDEEESTGNWNGENYVAVAHNHRPDHLALLPDAIGACSIQDGCGIRTNEKKGEEDVNNEEVERTELEILTVTKEESPGVFHSVIIQNNLTMSLMTLLDRLRSMVDAMDNTNAYHYLRDVQDNQVIYEKRFKQPVNVAGETKWFTQAYMVNPTNNEIEWVGDPVEVIQKVEYEPVNEGGQRMANNECKPCIEKRVTALIANAATTYTEEDRTWLQVLTEDQLDKMLPKEVEIPAPVNVLTQEDQAALEFGKKQLKARRETFIQGIQANTKQGTWTLEVFQKMEDDTLERVYNSVKKETVETVDYSLNGNSATIINNSDEALYPAGVQMESK